MINRAPQRQLATGPLFVFTVWCFLAGALLASAADGPITTTAPQRPPVHPRRNVDEFTAVDAKVLRFRIMNASGVEPCIDELEVYAEGTDQNVALNVNGTKVTGSGSLPGYKIHALENINDGLYGNGRSWISNLPRTGWVVLEFPEVVRVNRVVWGRDREGKFIDRLTTEYIIEVAMDSAGPWKQVASSADREPLNTGAEFLVENPAMRLAVTRFAPVATTLSSEQRTSPSDYIIDIWQSEDGLPSNTISSILQSSDGYLWIGTFHGLVRFDGLRFRTFGEEDGLPHSPISSLYQSRSGDLWIGTEGAGLVRYRDGIFRFWTAAEGLPHNWVLSMEEDASGRLWIGTMGGLCALSGEKLENYSQTAERVQQLRSDDAGNLWALIAGTLSLLKEGVRVPAPIREEPSSLSSLAALACGPGGEVWFAGANAYVGRWLAGALSVFGQSAGAVPDHIWELCAARNGDLWIGSDSGGLSRLRNGKIVTFTTQDGLSSNSIRTIFEDREENIWAGSNGGGLMRLKRRKLSTFSTRDGLSHEVIMSMAEEPGGQLWIGSNCGGLNTLRDEKGSAVFLNYLLDNACIWSLLRGRNGNLWIGTWGQGLFEKRESGVRNYTMSSGLSDNVILALCEDSGGGLWIGTYQGGLNYLNEGKVQRYTTRDGLPADFVTCIIESKNGDLWIGTSGGGLSRFDRDRFHTYTRAEGLGSNVIRTLYEAADGTIWVGTSGGLSRYDGSRIQTITEKQGLPSDTVSQLLEDDFGHLWIGSNQGIFRVRKEEVERVMERRVPTVAVVQYGKGEGMESLECTGGFHPAGLRTADGKLWFATIKGVVRVDPAEANRPGISPPVTVEEFLLDGKKLPLHQTEGKGRTTVQFGSGRIELRYTALSLSAPERVQFKYKLEGFDDSWTDAGTSRMAQYSRLWPGDYVFRVIARSAEGVWNEAGANFKFSVLPRFWQTWWFIAAASITAAASLAAAVRYLSVRKLRRRLERLEQQHALERERARIAQDIHDDIGATLTQITYLSDHGQRKPHRPEDVKSLFQQISQTAREVVQSLDQIVWAVNPRNDTLDHLANYLSQFAQEFLASTPIRCRLEMPSQVPDVRLSTEQRHNLFLATKEAIHNAVKHSHATEILLRLEVAPNHFTIEVEDNGRGFDPGVLTGRGDGLANMRVRLEQLGGSLEIESRSGRTVISFRLNYNPHGGSLVRNAPRVSILESVQH